MNANWAAIGLGQDFPNLTALGKPGNANGIIVMILISDYHDYMYHSVICSF